MGDIDCSDLDDKLPRYPPGRAFDPAVSLHNQLEAMVKGVADMAKQFEDVGSRYGAPMGRREYGRFPLGKVRLFRVRINSGGYDDGGAYWGIGQPLYCATDDDEYREFIRAWTRKDAAEALKLTDRLRRHA